MTMKTWILRGAVVLAGMACMAPGCDGDVLNDPTFHLWSDDGKTLRDWTLDVGTVHRAPTWHPNDYGIELVDTPTQISQASDQISECMEFSAIGDVEASAQAKLQVDFNGDGTPDFDSPIAETHWRMTKTLIFTPEGYTAAPALSFVRPRTRFLLRKDGPGRAVLAEIRVRKTTGCSGPRLELKGVAIGSNCASASQCASGTCCNAVCSACCAGPGASNACRDGVACTAAKIDSIAHGPMLCGAGESKGARGDACVNSNDCASQTCTGTVFHRVCFDGGVCAVDSLVAGRCE